ncbi:MAG: MerC domain-containing protein [Rhodanobacter sp.]|uniref:MerC domain-containing protein n=1 Tax=Rhodanobacter sp. KK11 TaxID=3083255 RepID=UPI0029672672|nr:MerC domain-containing protein [Rhodanobacter sp. KK11]MDW2981033.1 MerC domain-containing protein [Rhodanobacter sp. KK11]
MDSEQTNKSRWWHAADRVGAMASFLCAIHCALLPFVIALLPLLGLGFLADHRFERAFVLCACVLASFVLIRGYRRHQRALPLRLAMPGLALLLLGIVYIDGSVSIVHSVLVTSGGLLLASAHFANLRLDSRSDGTHVHGPQCAH